MPDPYFGARVWEELAHGRIPDIAELRAAREVMDPADENSCALTLALGVALGIRSQTNGSLHDRREATDCLLEGLETARGDHPWRYFGLKFFAGYLSTSGFIDSNAIPADRVLQLAEKGIAESAGRPETAGLYHMIACIARRTIAVQRNQPAGDGATLEHLNKARQLLSGDTDLSPVLAALSATFSSTAPSPPAPPRTTTPLSPLSLTPWGLRCSSAGWSIQISLIFSASG